MRTRPAWVAPGVAVVPLFSWYKTSFMGGGGREPLSPQEEHLLQKATRNMDHLVESSTAIGDTVEKDMMNRAGTHVAAAAAKHGR